jgi:hypothetical protein
MTVTIVAVYWSWIGPILKSRPAFAEFYARERERVRRSAWEAQGHQAEGNVKNTGPGLDSGKAVTRPKLEPIR